MTTANSILITGRDRHLLSVIAQILEGSSDAAVRTRVVSNGSVDPLENLSENPQLLILALSSLWREELGTLIERRPGDRPALILVTDERDPELMRLAMQAGSRDFFPLELLANGLPGSVKRIEADLKASQGSHGGDLVAVMNGKGGSGGSFLCANIAHILAKKYQQRVSVMDLNLLFANIPAYFDAKSSNSLSDALNAASEEMDITELRGFMTRHASKVDILANETENTMVSWAVPQEQLNFVVELMLAFYRYLLVDVPRSIEPMTQLILERANRILLVTQQSVMHLHDSRRLLNILTYDLAIPEARIQLVVNRFSKKNAISLGDIEDALGISKVTVIPNDYRYAFESANTGKLLYDLDPRAAVSKSIAELAAGFDDEFTKHRPGLLRRTLAGLTSR